MGIIRSRVRPDGVWAFSRSNHSNEDRDTSCRGSLSLRVTSEIRTGVLADSQSLPVRDVRSACRGLVKC